MYAYLKDTDLITADSSKWTILSSQSGLPLSHHWSHPVPRPPRGPIWDAACMTRLTRNMMPSRFFFFCLHTSMSVRGHVSCVWASEEGMEAYWWCDLQISELYIIPTATPKQYEKRFCICSPDGNFMFLFRSTSMWLRLVLCVYLFSL